MLCVHCVHDLLRCRQQRVGASDTSPCAASMHVYQFCSELTLLYALAAQYLIHVLQKWPSCGTHHSTEAIAKVFEEHLPGYGKALHHILLLQSKSVRFGRSFCLLIQVCPSGECICQLITLTSSMLAQYSNVQHSTAQLSRIEGISADHCNVQHVATKLQGTAQHANSSVLQAMPCLRKMLCKSKHLKMTV